ncbi:hypothetical protein glysoja_007830 [Glycine soja]|nr:hypothetical protein glysoja_007830 [Glycine soja]
MSHGRVQFPWIRCMLLCLLLMLQSQLVEISGGVNIPLRKYTMQLAGSCASKASQNKRKIQMEYNLLRFQHPSLNHHYKCIEGGSAYQEWNKKYVVKATSKPSFDSGLPTSNSKNMLDSVKNFLAAFYLFCYPYIMIGRALVPYTFLDVYINGLNQLSDIEIDKVPLLRWKRHPLLAAMCIFLSFTIIFPITFFLHMQLVCV